MTEWIWINGQTMPLAEATLSVEDRGYQFADGVYEVIRFYRGQPFTLAEHLDRLVRSAAGIDLSLDTPVDALAGEVRKLVARSGLADGMVYLQLTRGVAPRNHLFPADGVKPTLLFYCRALPPVAPAGRGAMVKLMPVADERWRRCWVKTIALLPNVLAKNAAAKQGYDEAAFVENNVVTECSASNLFAVIGGTVVTHPVGPKVLPGITREVLRQLAPRVGVTFEERPLTEAEVLTADELFITSTTREISPVSHWGERQIGAGTCGPVTTRLHAAYQLAVEKAIASAEAA
ncbi:MAG TPA: aminotransferase class IV [Tepidisphaeraceae bacterium]|nr:aminotransferase class IV [Tepidisphaeraceae bacterium]